ncbi:hypothetical protein AB0I84_36675 [Streptomyces spectabilis]|uniref:hypothetical protein n=1 Tax=Streptomyces spectabilis TaxID=68270 RepID=UPI0033E92AD5
MTATRKRALYSTATAAAIAFSGLAFTPGSATAANSGAQACDVFTFYKAAPYGKNIFASRGPVVSKRNSSSHASTLSISIKTTKSRASTWIGEAGGGLDWGLGKIEAKTSYSVENKVTRGATVTNRMKVDAKKRGFTQPGVLYRKFTIEKWRQNGNCSTTNLKTWHMKAIISKLHFAECQTRGSSCTPKP